jgi:hypothetical protein
MGQGQPTSACVARPSTARRVELGARPVTWS